MLRAGRRFVLARSASQDSSRGSNAVFHAPFWADARSAWPDGLRRSADVAVSEADLLVRPLQDKTRLGQPSSGRWEEGKEGAHPSLRLRRTARNIIFRNIVNAFYFFTRTPRAGTLTPYGQASWPIRQSRTGLASTCPVTPSLPPLCYRAYSSASDHR